MISVFIFNKFVGLTLGWCTSERFRQQVCLVSCQLAWRITILTSPWVRTSSTKETKNNYKKIAAQIHKSDSSFMVIANHASFFDTLMACSYFPQILMRRCRAYYSTHLDKIPVLGYICKTVGHFPVRFKSNEYGKFSVDREAMKYVMGKVDEFLATQTGNVLSYYPEGAMNRNPDKLQPFRYGGLKQALKHDVKLYAVITYGNDTIWPRKAGVGGFPGHARTHFEAFAPDGVRQLVEDLRKKADPNYDGTAPEPDDAHKLLAEYLHSESQRIYDQLKADVLGTDKSD